MRRKVALLGTVQASPKPLLGNPHQETLVLLEGNEADLNRSFRI